MSKLLIIDSCDMCPYFDNQYYTYEHTCTKTDTVISYEHENNVHLIPTNCPLEDGEN